LVLQLNDEPAEAPDVPKLIAWQHLDEVKRHANGAASVRHHGWEETGVNEE
jgi:hypothetical protein